MSAVLRRTCLSTSFQVRNHYRQHTASSACSSSAHPFHHRFIMPFLNCSITWRTINTIQLIILNLLHNMRCDKISAIGNRCTQIGYLERSSQNFSLPDRNTDYRQSIPMAAISLIIELCIRNQTTFLSGQINT